MNFKCRDGTDRIDGIGPDERFIGLARYFGMDMAQKFCLVREICEVAWRNFAERYDGPGEKWAWRVVGSSIF